MNHLYSFLSLSRLESSLIVGYELLDSLCEEVYERVVEIALNLLITSLYSRYNFNIKVSILLYKVGRPLVSKG